MKEKWIKIFDYVCEFSLYGLIFFIPISKAAIEIFFAFAFTGFLFKKILKPNFEFLHLPTHFFLPYLFLLLFISFSALSLINSGPYFVKSFISLFFKWMEYIFIFVIIGDTFTNRKRIRNALAVILSTSLLVGIDGLWQYFFNFEFLRHKSLAGLSTRIYAISASFNHHNDFAAYLLVILSLVSALFISRQKKLYKSALFLSLILLEICLLLTFSRGGWSAFIFILTLMLFISHRFKELVPAFIIFAILFIYLIFKKQILFFIFMKGYAGRAILWQTAFGMIKENPFLGKGIGTFMDYFSQHVPNLFTQYAHNCFLQIWAETGIFSLLSFLAFVILLLSKGIIAFKRNNNYLLLGMVCGIFGFLVHSFFDTQLYSLQLSALFWSMAGILAATIKLETDVSK